MCGCVNVVSVNIIVIFERRGRKNEYNYEGWNFNSGNYLFTTDTK